MSGVNSVQSNQRIAELMVQLMAGKTLRAEKIAAKYAVSARTSQRDFAYIRRALSEYTAGDLIEEHGTYRLSRRSEETDAGMVLAMSNILLGSRALTQTELSGTLDYLSSGLSPAMQTAMHQQLTLSRGSYVPLSRSKPLLHVLREVASCITQNQRMVFTYRSSRPGETHARVHHAQPVALFFETYYFYVAMLSEEHAGYWLYRLDRIQAIQEKLPGEKLDYDERYSLQEHRNYAYLLDSGSLTRIRFRYYNYVQTALDHFPGSRVIREYPDGSYVIEAYVKIDGAVLWLLSQGAGLRVLSPVSLVDRMRAMLQATLEQYE